MRNDEWPRAPTTTLRSYFQQGDIWEQEIIKRAKRSARVAWFFALVFAGPRGAQPALPSC